MEYQYVTSISAQKTVKNFSKTDETAEVGLGITEEMRKGDEVRFADGFPHVLAGD
jgi:hypothetical protein